MSARKRSKELQKAEIQKVQEKVHQVLYCDTNWDEDGIYRLRFEEILHRSNLSRKTIEIDEDAAIEYKRRVERKLKGIEELDKSLVFYKILNILVQEPMNKETLFIALENHSEDCINNNLQYLEKSGALEADGDKHKVSNHIRKLLLKTM
ncbi:MAG: hypothetical protein E3K37_08470 [Candidatus Kuenenia sp.]|nr:hypothetical protein [Candidatus Kuenenia hertensis]